MRAAVLGALLFYLFCTSYYVTILSKAADALPDVRVAAQMPIIYKYADRISGHGKVMDPTSSSEERNGHVQDEFMYQRDPRFKYYLHLPHSFQESSPEEKEEVPFVVIVHGLSRNARELFNKAVSEHSDWVILVPIFPRSVGPPGYCGGVVKSHDGNSYRLLLSRPLGYSPAVETTGVDVNEIRFDQVLLGIIYEVKASTGLEYGQKHKITLVGYSAGAQFSHRFAYLHASMLNVLAIGAPGTITLWDEKALYWRGTKDISTVFRKDPELDHLKDVKVIFFVGSNDTKRLDSETGQTIGDSGEHGRNHASGHKGYKTRVELIGELYDNWDSLGLGKSRQLKKIMGVGHDSTEAIGRALDFVEEALES